MDVDLMGSQGICFSNHVTCFSTSCNKEVGEDLLRLGITKSATTNVTSISCLHGTLQFTKIIYMYKCIHFYTRISYIIKL